MTRRPLCAASAFLSALLLPAAAPPAIPSRTPARPLRLLFASDRTGTWQIFAVTASGRRLAQLTFGRPRNCASPPGGDICGWQDPLPSPDGRFVLFRAGDELWIMGADGSSRRRLVRGSQPSWSADSRRIAYVSTTSSSLRVVNADGSRDSVLAGGKATNPAWSPRGQRLVFLREGEGGELSLILLAGRSERTLAAGFTAPYGTRTPAWSPNGRWVAYRREAELHVIRPDGSGDRRIASFAGGWAWSPDSRRIAFLGAGQYGFFDLEVADLATGRTRRLSPGPLGADSLAWSPSDGTIAAQLYGLYGGEGIALVTPSGQTRKLKLVLGAVGRPVWTRPPRGTRYRPPAPLLPAEQVSPTEVGVRTRIAQIAADGARVAFSFDSWPGPSPRDACNVAVWRPRERRVGPSLIGPQISACRYRYSTFSLGLSASGPAYVTVQGVNSLLLSGVGFSAFASTGCCAGRTQRPGGHLGDVLGDGDLLVFSTWDVCDPYVVNSSCPGGTFAVDSQTIWRARAAGFEGSCPYPDGLHAGPCQQLAAADGELSPLAVDAGRIVVRRADGELAVLDANGHELRSLPFAPGEALAAALSGRDLVVLIRGVLRDYDADSGSLMHIWPVPDVASGGYCGSFDACPTVDLRLEGAARGIATYIVDGQVHLLRLSDGGDVVVHAGTASQLDDAGLFYAFTASGRYPSRIRFVPFAKLPLR